MRSCKLQAGISRPANISAAQLIYHPGGGPRGQLLVHRVYTTAWPTHPPSIFTDNSKHPIPSLFLSLLLRLLARSSGRSPVVSIFVVVVSTATVDNHPRNRELSSGPEDQFPIIHGTRIYIGNEVINTAFTRRPRLGSPPAVWKGREDGSDKFLATVQRFEFREAVFPPDTNGRRAQNRIETAKLAELAPLNEPVTVERIEEMAGREGFFDFLSCVGPPRFIVSDLFWRAKGRISFA